MAANTKHLLQMQLCLLLMVVVAGFKLNASADEGSGEGDQMNLAIGPRVTIEIRNYLSMDPADHINLTVHCKSKDDDKGFYTIQTLGVYQFKIRPNFFAVITLYFCSFSWPAEPSLHYVDIFDQNRDDCRFCQWMIWRGGACKYSSSLGGYRECYPWHDNNPISAETKLGLNP